MGAKRSSRSIAAAAPAEPLPPGTIRLELVQGSSKKFWQIRRDAKSYVVTFGRIGSAGQTQKTTLKDEWQCRREVDKLVDEKQRKGYQLAVLPGKGDPTAIAARDPEIEKAIVAHPASDDNFMIYADWLQTQGDVRGELAAIQARLGAAKADTKKLRAAEAKLLRDHRVHFWGPLAAYVGEKAERDVPVSATWRQGWIDTLRLSAVSSWSTERSGLPSVQRAAELIRLLPRVASARFVRELVIGCPVVGGEFNFHDAIKELVKAMPSLPALRRLTLGDFSYEDSELSWSHLGPLDALWRVAGNLEYLKIHAGSMSLGKIVAPELRELRIETGGLDRKSLKSITSASWPKLETLHLWFGQEDYGCDCEPADTQPLLDGAKLPKLRHLGIANTTFGDELAAMLRGARILRQLETLDLSMSHLTSRGVAQLAESKVLAHLQRLDLSRCLLDSAAQKLARTLAKTVDVSQQEDPGEYAADDDDEYEFRYSAVGE